MNSPKFTSDCSKDSPPTRFASVIPTSSRDGTTTDSRRATPIPRARAAPALPIASSAAWNACWPYGRRAAMRKLTSQEPVVELGSIQVIRFDGGWHAEMLDLIDHLDGS